MPKFKVGDTVMADRSKALAEIIFIDIYLSSYLVRFKDTHFGTQSYKIEVFDPHWSLITPQTQSFEKKCTCGIKSCYGDKAPVNFHSDYCDLIF
jgi:hypothetical protein